MKFKQVKQWHGYVYNIIGCKYIVYNVNTIKKRQD